MARSTHNTHRAVVEKIQVAIEADDVHLLRVGEIAGNVIEGEADIRPPGSLQLVVLDDEGRIRELADIAAVIEVQVTSHHVFNVVCLEANFGKLRRNRVILRHLEAKALGERSPPTLGVGYRLVVVSGVDNDVALGMFEHVEAHRRPVDIALPAHLQGGLRETSQRAGCEDVEFRALLRDGRRSSACRKAERGNETQCKMFDHCASSFAFGQSRLCNYKASPDATEAKHTTID